MPKELTHCILAERAAYTMAASSNKKKREIGCEIYFLFEKAPQLLYFGSIAPDIFFYDIAVPWEFGVKKRGGIWGDLIHGTDGENSLAHVFEMFEILRDASAHKVVTGGRPFTDAERDGLMLFILGYLSHVALDTVMHPLVYFLSGNYYDHDPVGKRRAEGRHRAFETILDLYNLESIGSDLKKFRGIKKMALPKKWRNLVIAFYAHSLCRAWPEVVKREYGNINAESPITKHPLYTIALRGYKKEILFNRWFERRTTARLALWLNYKRHDALQAYSSLVYPADSYAAYCERYAAHCLLMSDVKSYRDPVDNKECRINEASLRAKSLARAQAFFRTAWRYVHGAISRTAAESVFKPYSLNNGRVGVRTDAMRHFGALPINGNFEYMAR